MSGKSGMMAKASQQSFRVIRAGPWVAWITPLRRVRWLSTLGGLALAA
jgi:hypothetical protein